MSTTILECSSSTAPGNAQEFLAKIPRNQTLPIAKLEYNWNDVNKLTTISSLISNNNNELNEEELEEKGVAAFS
ncbi:hypothetical protein ACLB2K_033012 [Fragaria x ananassa]